MIVLFQELLIVGISYLYVYVVIPFHKIAHESNCQIRIKVTYRNMQWGLVQFPFFQKAQTVS